MIGFCIPSPDGQDILGYLRPTICTELEQVRFWHVQTGAKSLEQAVQSVDLSNLYASLDRPQEGIFPVTFAADVEVDSGDVASGVVEGFNVLAYLPAENAFKRAIIR
jgi:hypothetical protein